MLITATIKSFKKECNDAFVRREQVLLDKRPDEL